MDHKQKTKWKIYFCLRWLNHFINDPMCGLILCRRSSDCSPPPAELQHPITNQSSAHCAFNHLSLKHKMNSVREVETDGTSRASCAGSFFFLRSHFLSCPLISWFDVMFSNLVSSSFTFGKDPKRESVKVLDRIIECVDCLRIKQFPMNFGFISWSTCVSYSRPGRLSIQITNREKNKDNKPHTLSQLAPLQRPKQVWN